MQWQHLSIPAAAFCSHGGLGYPAPHARSVRSRPAPRGRGRGRGGADRTCPLHSKTLARARTAVETEAGEQMAGQVCLMVRGRARTPKSHAGKGVGGARPPSHSSGAEARPGSHRRSFTKKVSRPAPRSHSPAPAETQAPAACGSAPRTARAPASAAVPSPRGPFGVRLELTVPPARRAPRSRAPCSRRAARRRAPPQRARARPPAEPARTAQVRARPEPSRSGGRCSRL